MPDPQDNGAPGIEMRSQQTRPPPGTCSGSSAQRGPAWYAKYRLADGRQVQGSGLGRRGRREADPPAGYFTKRLARGGCAMCSTRLGAATVAGRRCSTGATFEDAAAEYLRYVEHDREHQALDSERLSARSSASHLLPAFGERAPGGHHRRRHRGLASPRLGVALDNRTKNKGSFL